MHVAIAIGCVVIWIVGTLACARRRRGPILLVALGGSCALATIAATRTEWPIGFVRANLFLIPMLYVLGAIGLYTLVQATSRHRQGARTTLTIALIFCVAVAATGLWRLDQVHASARRHLSLDQMRSLVAQERRVAVPDDLFVVLTRHAAITQWLKAHLYYATLSDRTRMRFPNPETNELGLGNPSVEKTRAFLQQHPAPHHVFLVAYFAAHPAAIAEEIAALRKAGFCPSNQRDFGTNTQNLTILQPC